MADIKQTQGVQSIKPFTVTGALVDTSKRDSFRGFGTQIGALNAPEGSYDIFIFGGVIEIHAPGGSHKRLMAEVDLAGLFNGMREMITKHVEAAGPAACSYPACKCTVSPHYERASVCPRGLAK